MWFEGGVWSLWAGSEMSNLAFDLRLFTIASLIITRKRREITPKATPSTKYNTAFSLFSEIQKENTTLISNWSCKNHN